MKFVLKSHFQALGSEDKRSMTEQADKELEAGRDFLLHLRSKNRIIDAQYTELLGMYRVRYDGYITKLSEQIFEKKK